MLLGTAGHGRNGAGYASTCCLPFCSRDDLAPHAHHSRRQSVSLVESLLASDSRLHMDSSGEAGARSQSYKYVVAPSSPATRMPHNATVKKGLSGISQLYDEHIELEPVDLKPVILTQYDQRFVMEDKAVVFAMDTFLEESLVQTSFSLLGPLCWVFAIPICTLDGLKLTGFWPGKLKSGSSTGTFIFQTIFAYTLQLPVFVFLAMYWTSNLTTFPDSSILPTTHIMIPACVQLVRQIVIGVKYAFIPRRKMRTDRHETRHDEDMTDDLLATWMGTPRNESLAYQLDLCMWRADLSGIADEEYITFVTPIPAEIIKEFDLPEVTPPLKSSQEKSVKGAPNVDVDGMIEDGHAPSEVVSTNKIPLRTLVKYASFTGTRAVKLPMQFVLCSVLPLISVPLLYLGLAGYPLFGTPGKSLEQTVCAIGFLNIFMSLPSNMIMFPLAPFVIFERSRFRLNQFFELLIPSTIVDARNYNPIHMENAFKKLPPMVPTARNVLMWNKGRRALQKFGIFYRRRAEVFTAIYIFLVVAFSVYQVVQIFITTSIGISESMCIVVVCAFLVTVVIMKMIFAGIKLNRQRKLMVAAIKDFLVRAKLGSIHQAESLVNRFEDNGDKDRKDELKHGLKKLRDEAADFHKALKLVDGAIESEEVTEKARILGVTVDMPMLEFILATLASTAYTIYDAL